MNSTFIITRDNRESVVEWKMNGFLLRKWVSDNEQNRLREMMNSVGLDGARLCGAASIS